MKDQQKNQAIVIPTQIENEDFLPAYATAQAAGADVRAHISEPKTLSPGTSCLVPTGMRIEIPEGYEIQVRPRSGLALKHQVTILNTPGTIDADYRGEVGVILINHGRHDFVIEPGMRIAQLVLAPMIKADFRISLELSSTQRAAGGFGHTGAH
jgi:dUTP pyrophosphatase